MPTAVSKADVGKECPGTPFLYTGDLQKRHRRPLYETIGHRPTRVKVLIMGEMDSLIIPVHSDDYHIASVEKACLKDLDRLMIDKDAVEYGEDGTVLLR